MMNAGQTAERVFDALRTRILEANFRPGDRLDPAVLAAELNSSVTPVRDALHLLTGRGLVDARPGDGFHLPGIDAPGLEDLYGWNAEVLALALRAGGRGSATHDASAAPEVDTDVRGLFARIGRASRNVEHARTLDALNDRLHAVRIAETAVFDDLSVEFDALRSAVASGASRIIQAEIARYHRRRRRRAAEIARALYRRD